MHCNLGLHTEHTTIFLSGNYNSPFPLGPEIASQMIQNRFHTFTPTTIKDFIGNYYSKQVFILVKECYVPYSYFTKTWQTWRTNRSLLFAARACKCCRPMR